LAIAVVCALAAPTGAAASELDFVGRSTSAFRAADTAARGLSEAGVAPRAGMPRVSSPRAAAEPLPPAEVNVDLVSKLELVMPGGAPPVNDQIADVAVYKNAAYLNSWAEPDCTRGGFFSVDITDPANPVQKAFVPALPGRYHGEGAHAITIDVPGFKGDVLAVNNEPCVTGNPGGFDLYDVSNPADPKILVQGAGDRSPDHADGNPFAPTTQNPQEVPNASHSVFMWQHGQNAYVVITDNTEFSDVDIFDITNPRAPRFITDVDLLELSFFQTPMVDLVDDLVPPATIYQHDMVVKTIDGVPTLLSSYWDVGYVKVDVSDPARPVLIGDSAFGLVDPVMNIPGTTDGWPLPEGNAHQAEFSHDNQFVLAADEDFDTHPRFLGEIDQGAGGIARFLEAGPTLTDDPVNPALAGPQITRTRPLVGDTRYVGDGCDSAAMPPASPAEGVTIAVVEAFGCAFRQKTQEVGEAGYKGLIIFAPSNAEHPDINCNDILGLLGYTSYVGDVITLWVTR
jgi:hypothetical protein